MNGDDWILFSLVSYWGSRPVTRDIVANTLLCLLKAKEQKEIFMHLREYT